MSIELRPYRLQIEDGYREFYHLNWRSTIVLIKFTFFNWTSPLVEAGVAVEGCYTHFLIA